MNGLLSIIGMKTELDYLIGDLPACFGDTPLVIPKGNIPSDKQKCQPKAQHGVLSRKKINLPPSPW